MRRYLAQYATRARSLWIALSLAMAMSLLLVACGGTDTTTTPSPTTAATTAPTTAPTTAATTTGTTGTVHTVEIHETNGKYFFMPAALTIKVGETVMWINKTDAAHTVTSDTGVFGTTSNLAMNQTFMHTFAKAATYPYHCTIHPYMKAIITVK